MSEKLEVGGANREFPGGNLSNFSPHAFEFDGVHCASMEGFLQSLKFLDVIEQLEVCTLVGSVAKKRGATKSGVFWMLQTLWWRGKAFDRHGPEYQELLDRAFKALFTNEEFRTALRASGDAVLIHSIGNPDPAKTILTEREFCDRLMKLREQLVEL